MVYGGWRGHYHVGAGALDRLAAPTGQGGGGRSTPDARSLASAWSARRWPWPTPVSRRCRGSGRTGVCEADGCRGGIEPGVEAARVMAARDRHNGRRHHETRMAMDRDRDWRFWRRWTGQPAAAADHEGQVVVYTAAQSTIVQAVGPMFEKKTGIKVQFVEGGHRRGAEAGGGREGQPARRRLLGPGGRAAGGERRPAGAVHGDGGRQDQRHLQEGDGGRPGAAQQRDAHGHRVQQEAGERRRRPQDLEGPGGSEVEGQDRLCGGGQVGLVLYHPGDAAHGVRRQRRRLEGRRGHHEERQDPPQLQPGARRGWPMASTTRA